MDKHCIICHNTSCSNHGKNISFLGDGWKCNYIPVPTNADRIRSMSDEELLGCLLELQDMAIKRFANFEPPDYQWMADWLQMPTEEDKYEAD